MLNFIALQVYDKKFATELYTKKVIDGIETNDTCIADIMLSDERHGLIIEMKYTKKESKEQDQKTINIEKSKVALQQAKEYSDLIPRKGKIGYIQIFCGISISEK